METQNKKIWGGGKQTVLLYPNEKVVAFLGRNFADREQNRSKKALDLGFGSGRHIKLLLDYGFETFGLDYVPECVEITKSYFGHYDNLRKLITGDFTKYDFAANNLKDFDVIIIWGTIFWKHRQEMLKDLKKITSLLSPNGKIYLNFRSKDDVLYGKGKVLDEGYTFELNYKEYSGLTYTFLDVSDIETMLKAAGLKVTSFEKEEYWKNNLTERHSWWLVSAEKASK